MPAPSIPPKFIPALSANPGHRAIFQQFEHFSNYIRYAFEFTTPEIWVDHETNPTLACLFTPPAYFVWGDPDGQDLAPLFQMFSPGCWIVPSSEKWDPRLVAHFAEKLTAYPRTAFDSASLDLAHLRGLKSDLPPGLQIAPIAAAHIQDQDGMLYDDLLCRFFTQAEFLEQGAGFCLLEGERIIGFAAANYPIRDRVLEVYIRVDYNDNPVHRQKGLGTQLGVTLLEYCLENGLDPQWDAANDASVRLALRLGYPPHHSWKMYHYQG